jgi:hypothetical protein
MVAQVGRTAWQVERLPGWVVELGLGLERRSPERCHDSLPDHLQSEKRASSGGNRVQSGSAEPAGGQIATSTKWNGMGCCVEVEENGSLLVSCSSLIPTRSPMLWKGRPQHQSPTPPCHPWQGGVGLVTRKGTFRFALVQPPKETNLRRISCSLAASPSTMRVDSRNSRCQRSNRGCLLC